MDQILNQFVESEIKAIKKVRQGRKSGTRNAHKYNQSFDFSFKQANASTQALNLDTFNMSHDTFNA